MATPASSASSSASSATAPAAAAPAAKKEATPLMNSAFVFVKPHANTKQVRDLVRATFGKQNIEITREGELTAAEIDAKKLIDQHYYSIASKATILKPASINVPADQFEKAFGLPWAKALSEGRAFNAQDACTELGIDAAELDKRWGTAKKNNKMTKFGGGFYCAELAREGGKSTIFVFNGFFMTMRQKFVAKNTSIYFFCVSFEPAKLNWADFRAVVLGATDPSTAQDGSLRKEVYSNWQALGLQSQPNVGDNGIHASASPFEGLAERINWLGVKAQDDVFGKELVAAGVCAKTIAAWTLDPQVELDGGRLNSLFDTVEDTDALQCLALCQYVAKRNAPPQHMLAKIAASAGSGFLLGVVAGAVAAKVFKL